MLSILKRSQKGFTLIEMLVVIAIISILIGIGVNTFTVAQKKARDVRRKADITNIKKALVAYGLDKNNDFRCASPLATCTSLATLGLATTYIPVVPKDPSTGNDYLFSGTNGNFKLQATLENTGDPDKAPVAAVGATNCTVAVTATDYFYCQSGDQ